MPTDPYRYLSDAADEVKDLAHTLYTITRATAAHTWPGRGWSPDSPEHATRRALDYIIAVKVGQRPTAAQRANGDLIAAWLVRHAKRMHIRHIIWNRRIYRTRYGQWGPLPGRTSSSSVSDWHEDHLHIWLEDLDGDIPSPAEAPLIAATPTAPTPAPATPPSPSAGVLRTGSRGARVTALQRGLNRAFPAYRHTLTPRGRLLTVDAIFGEHTERWVREFQRRAGLAVDGIVGPSTRTALRRNGVNV